MVYLAKKHRKESNAQEQTPADLSLCILPAASHKWGTEQCSEMTCSTPETVTIQQEFFQAIRGKQEKQRAQFFEGSVWLRDNDTELCIQEFLYAERTDKKQQDLLGLLGINLY